jgi:hypothetical protein
VTTLSRQCELHAGPWRTVAWVPIADAKVGQRVRVAGSERLWTVAIVYRTIREYDDSEQGQDRYFAGVT